MLDVSVHGVHIGPVALGDPQELFDNMRGPDRAEIAASGVSDALAAVHASVGVSLWSYAARVDGELACLFGVVATNLLRAEGSPWLLGTKVMDRNPVAFMRLAPFFVEEMLGTFSYLHNYVDARNIRAVKWLKHAGFTIHEARPVQPDGFLFHPFDLGA